MALGNAPVFTTMQLFSLGTGTRMSCRFLHLPQSPSVEVELPEGDCSDGGLLSRTGTGENPGGRTRTDFVAVPTSTESDTGTPSWITKSRHNSVEMRIQRSVGSAKTSWRVHSWFWTLRRSSPEPVQKRLVAEVISPTASSVSVLAERH